MALPHGDYTDLAQEYSRNRPGYAPELPQTLRDLAKRDGAQRPHFVDVGAGTGIWTRMVAHRAWRTTAVEPNAQMRACGVRDSEGLPIEWVAGSAEQTGLEENSCDLLTMASSFHWADFGRATAEFARVLRPGGVFAALWNTRVIEANPLLVEIEAELDRLVPGLVRNSSGRSAFCRDLASSLESCGSFGRVGYVEMRHTESMTPERYLGIWRSVNDVRVQAGEEVFAEFIDHVAAKTSGLERVEATYSTRAWTARVPERL